MTVAADGWLVALVAATALHAGFQATVTVLVYPALALVPRHDWSRAHDLHSRTITPLVAVVYGAALIACVGAALSSPRSVTVWGAVLATAGVFAVTALVAAPTHDRLGQGRTDALVTRLLRADRARLVLALAALVSALAAAS